MRVQGSHYSCSSTVVNNDTRHKERWLSPYFLTSSFSCWLSPYFLTLILLHLWLNIVLFLRILEPTGKISFQWMIIFPVGHEFKGKRGCWVPILDEPLTLRRLFLPFFWLFFALSLFSRLNLVAWPNHYLNPIETLRFSMSKVNVKMTLTNSKYQ